MVALLDTAGRIDLELERFEKIPAGDRYSLLRVDGRWVLAPGVDAPEPTLVVQLGARRERFAPLPGAAAEWRHDDGRAWSAGFAVPLDLILDARVRFWLEAAGPRYPLPRPEDRPLLDGHRAEVVIRNGRPHLLLACGLMAVALAPGIVHPVTAGAQDSDVPDAIPPADVAPAVTVTAPADPAPVITTPVDPPAATTPAAPAAAPAPAPAPARRPVVVKVPAKPHRAPAAKPQHATPEHRAEPTQQRPAAKKHAKRHHAKHHRHAAPAKQITPTKAGLDPTPHITSVPSPLLESFAIPPFLLPIYQAAATEYDVPWQLLAAINQVETNYGRNLNVSSAGAEGWMQFMPATWATYGVDANLDGNRDPSNPADAIFAAARYLHAAGASQSIRRAVYAYNHADWYVDMVLGKERALERVPTGAVAALTGLAIGRFPVPGPHVTYTRAADGWVSAAGASGTPTVARVSGPVGREVVAPTTARVLYLGRSSKGVFAVLEDAYGNRFTYGHLRGLVRHYVRVRTRRPSAEQIARELGLDSAGKERVQRVAYKAAPDVARTTWPADKERLYAHPARPGALPHGGRAQLDAAPQSVLAAAARRLGVRPDEAVMARLRPGAIVAAGTVIGHLGGALSSHGRAHVLVRIHPAGKHALQIDPSPILEAWRLAARGAMGPTSSRTSSGTPLGLGRTMLLSDHQLARMVLADPRVDLTDAGRDDVRSGQTDRRVLISLEALADARLHPSVSALRSGPAGDAARALGRGFEIVALNHDRLGRHRTRRSVASRALRVLRSLPSPLAPRHARLAATAEGTTAYAATTSTAEGRLTVSFPRHPHTSRAVGRAVDALLSGGAPAAAGAQGAGAPDLKGAPQAVKDIAAGADAIAGLPYVWGGGHGRWDVGGYDCSGSVSYALHAAGLLDAPLTSGELASWGEDGAGRWVTIYANPTHVIMEIAGQFYGTSGFGHPETGGGPGWFSVTPSPEYLANFSVRHPAGL
ncbi:MAG TPA: lytic murein transglycosylase [Solirubrobacteraceae bacterium]